MSNQERKVSNIPLWESLTNSLKEDIPFDQTLTEGEIHKLLSLLLPMGEEKGINAPDLDSTIKITDKGLLVIEKGKIQIINPNFKGDITFSIDFFNSSSGILSARNLEVSVEGGNFITRFLIESAIREKLTNPQQTLFGALNGQAEKETDGKRHLKELALEIDGARKSLRLSFSTRAKS